MYIQLVRLARSFGLRNSKLGSGYELASWRHSASVVVRASYPISKENEPFLLGQVEYFLAGLSIDWDPGDREQDVPDLLTFLKRTR
jgi:hypothetical protein